MKQALRMEKEKGWLQNGMKMGRRSMKSILNMEKEMGQ